MSTILRKVQRGNGSKESACFMISIENIKAGFGDTSWFCFRVSADYLKEEKDLCGGCVIILLGVKWEEGRGNNQ